MTRALLEQALAALETCSTLTSRQWFEATRVEAATDAIRAHLAKPDTAPAWKDAPTKPGLWLNPVSKKAISVTQYAIEKSIWANCGDRWFGPIPEDKP